MKRWQIVTLIVTAVILATVLGGGIWYLWGPCGKQLSTTAWSDIRPTLSRWFDAYYADNLEGMIASWQFSNTIYVPACMQAKMFTVNQAFEDMIKAKRAERAGDAENSVYLMLGPTVIKEAGLELERLSICAPFCR